MPSAPMPPPGYRLVPDGAQLSRTVAFRVTDDEEALLEELRDVMSSRKMSEAFRWLLANEQVRKVAMEHVKAARHE